MKPELCHVGARRVWKMVRAGLRRALLDGLRKAGLESAAEKGAAAVAPDLARSAAADSGVARAEEGFWVAVLPFKYSGATPISRLWPTGFPRTSSPACRASPTSR